MTDQILMWVLGIGGSLFVAGAAMWARKVSASLDSINRVLLELAHFEGGVEGHIKDSNRRHAEMGRRVERLEDAKSHG